MHMISSPLPVFSDRADASLMAEVEARGDIRDGFAYLTMQEYQICLLQNSKPRSAGLGDMMATGLSAIGITKERVSALAGGDCGCSKRQQQLNELGRKIGIG